MTGQLADLLSFPRIARIPFDACMAALDSWPLTGHGELRLGKSLLRGPIERDHHAGTCRIEVRLTRGPLRPPVRMRLDIEPWSPTATALELIPCQRVRPSAAYFAAGHRLLDSLTRTLPARVPAGSAPIRTICAQPSARAPRLSAARSHRSLIGDAMPDDNAHAAEDTRKLRARFPRWGILFDPLESVWIAVRGKRTLVVASSPEKLTEQVEAAARGQPGPPPGPCF